MTDVCFTEMEHISFLGGLAIRFTVNRLKQIDLICFLVALMINIIIFMTYMKKVKFNYTYDFIEQPFPAQTEQIILVFGVFHILFSVVKMIFHLVINIKLIVRKKWSESVQHYS